MSAPPLFLSLFLTTAPVVPLFPGPAVLLPLGGPCQFLCHLVLQPRHADQEALLVDGLLQGLDGGLHLLLHALSQAVEVTARCGGTQGAESRGPQDTVLRVFSSSTQIAA